MSTPQPGVLAADRDPHRRGPGRRTSLLAFLGHGLRAAAAPRQATGGQVPQRVQMGVVMGLCDNGTINRRAGGDRVGRPTADTCHAPNSHNPPPVATNDNDYRHRVRIIPT